MRVSNQICQICNPSYRREEDGADVLEDIRMGGWTGGWSGWQSEWQIDEWVGSHAQGGGGWAGCRMDERTIEPAGV